MNLTQRINERREGSDKIVPLVERRGGTERRQPTWITRMQDGQLAPKDLTGKAA